MMHTSFSISAGHLDVATRRDAILTPPLNVLRPVRNSRVADGEVEGKLETGDSYGLGTP
jgi:hypothetical protein